MVTRRRTASANRTRPQQAAQAERPQRTADTVPAPQPPATPGEERQDGPSRTADTPNRARAATAAPANAGSQRRVRQTVSTWRHYGVLAFAAVMVVGGVVGLLFFARPTMSEAENRMLTPFPEFTAERFLNGSYFTDLSLWYADTYPLREPMVSADRAMNGLMGVQPETQMIGGNRTSDELPTAESAGNEAKPTHEHNVSAPESGTRAANLEDQITDGVYVTDGACYTLYYFDDDATHEYAGVINDAAKLLGDEATVYSVLIPTNAGVMLDDQTLKDLGVPNQGQAIDYFYSLMSDDVITVPTFDTLREHKDEYLYFRTDHHWTQLGAYYVYESFCKVKGIEPAPFFEWKTLVFEPFWGEYDGVADLASFQPDSVEAHIPQGTNTMTYWVDDLDPSTKMEGPIVADLSDLDDENANKYNCFVCGNRPMSYIENPNVTDGSSCLVIKDSFGNPFVATLVDSYQYIYTLDFRFTSQKLLDIVREHDIDDVIFENVIMFAGTYDAVDLLSSIVYPDESAADEGSSEAADETTAGGEPVGADAIENEAAESTA